MSLTSCTRPPPHDPCPWIWGPISAQPRALSCSGAPACPWTPLMLTCGLASHLDFGPVPSPWTCPMIVGLCLTLVTWLRPSPDPGLQNGFPVCLQTCLITVNLPDGLQAAPGPPCSLPGAVGLVPGPPALRRPHRSWPRVPQAAQ